MRRPLVLVLLCSCAPAYVLIPHSELAERRVCGTVRNGEDARVRAFNHNELRAGSFAAERARIERSRVLLDVYRIGVIADAHGQYCLTLPDQDQYVLAFSGADGWATVVWTEPSGGTLDVELHH